MWRDDAYLLDILIAVRRVMKFVEDTTAEGFERNELMQHAVMRQLEIIGEASRCISQETKDRHPEAAWKQMVGMRNRLVHEYFRIDVGKVWDAVTNDVPVLISLIEPLVPPDKT
jgi:uncharacterized protein with HEPN domain